MQRPIIAAEDAIPLLWYGTSRSKVTTALRFAVAVLSLRPVPGFAQAPTPARVLFVGNSLTYANDLPGMVTTLAKAAGRPIHAESVALPDFGLEEHWQQGDARKAIARGGWTFVVLQQGPSALPESRRMLIDYVKRFDQEIKAMGAKTALYMVWPSQQRRGDFSGVSQSQSRGVRSGRNPDARRRRLARGMGGGFEAGVVRARRIPPVADGHLPGGVGELSPADRNSAAGIACLRRNRRSGSATTTSRRASN